MTSRSIPAAVASMEISRIPVESHTLGSLTQRILEMARTDGVDVAVGVNADVCNRARRSEHFRRLVADSVTYADGQSVVWAGRVLGGQFPERLATTDIAVPVLRAAAAGGIPAYFLGARQSAVEEAARRLRAQIPALALRTHHGYLGDDDIPAVLRDIRDHGTGILFVGMGDPAQQLWIEAHRAQLPPAVLTCGGLFDWLSGDNPRPPSWLVAAGLEWLWRLGLEPRRLARRYLLGNPAFVAAVLRQFVRGSSE